MGWRDTSKGKGTKVKPDDLHWIPGTHVVEGENQPQVFFSQSHVYCGTNVPTNVHACLNTRAHLNRHNFKLSLN